MKGGGVASIIGGEIGKTSIAASTNKTR